MVENNTMMKKLCWATALGISLLASGVTHADEVASGAEANTKKLSALLLETFKSAPDSISESQIPGLYQVMYGTEVVYLSADGQYFISGDLLNLKTRENLSEVAQRNVRKKIVDELKTTPVRFKAKDEKHVLRVFTDIDCGYCRKLHEEIDGYNDLGIGVSYVFFPRTGLDTASYDKAVNVWCAADQKKALSNAKAGGTIEPKMCENPIKSQFMLGIQAGIHKVGTPSIVFDDGTLVRGFLPPAGVKSKLEHLERNGH